MDWQTTAVIAAGIVIVIGIFVFRASISRLIDRISSANKDGVTFGSTQDIREDNPPPLPFNELMAQPVSASVLEREQAIQSQLQEYKLKNEGEKISALSRALATTRIAMEFNDIAYRIYGSQMSVLYHLSSTHNGISVNNAELIFEKAKSEFPELYENRKLEEWLMYLQVNNLIFITDGIIDITQYGTDFLKHLVDARITYNRYG